jgi:predicted RNase H-like HicB family nuclease
MTMINPLVYRSPDSFEVVFERGPHNWSAWVPELPGCVSTGRSRAACARNIREAIAGHLETMYLYGDGPGTDPLPGRSLPIPKPPAEGTGSSQRAS